MTKYLLAIEVEADLDVIWEYIAKDNLDAADHLIERFFDAFDTLAQDPGTGHTRTDLTYLPIKFWPVGSYLILYRLRREQVEIVAVTHGARDIPSFLRRRD